MNNQPITFAEQQYYNHFNLQPSEVKGFANGSVAYYKRVLYNKVYSKWEFNLPDHWDLNWFRFWLFHYGSIGVIYTNEYGWVCNPYSFAKMNHQWNPQLILVVNSFFKKEYYGEIGVNAAIIKLFDDYFGIDDIVTRYAEMLAQCDRSVNVSLINSNVTYLFEAQSKKRANEIKQAYGEATTGSPLVVLNEKVMDGKSIVPLLPNIKNNFIAPEILEVRRAITNAFLTEIGIRNVSVQKKERLTQGEYEENNEETTALIRVMHENVVQGMEVGNKISGLNLSAEIYEENVSRETSEEGEENG